MIWPPLSVTSFKKMYISVYETLTCHLKVFSRPLLFHFTCVHQPQMPTSKRYLHDWSVCKGMHMPVPASSKMSQFTSLSLLGRKDFLFIRKLRLFPARVFRLTLKKLPVPFYPTTQTKNLPINVASQNDQMRNLRLDPLLIIWKTSTWVQASLWSFL